MLFITILLCVPLILAMLSPLQVALLLIQMQLGAGLDGAGVAQLAAKGRALRSPSGCSGEVAVQPRMSWGSVSNTAPLRYSSIWASSAAQSRRYSAIRRSTWPSTVMTPLSPGAQVTPTMSDQSVRMMWPAAVSEPRGRTVGDVGITGSSRRTDVI